MKHGGEHFLSLDHPFLRRARIYFPLNVKSYLHYLFLYSCVLCFFGRMTGTLLTHQIRPRHTATQMTKPTVWRHSPQVRARYPSPARHPTAPSILISPSIYTQAQESPVEKINRHVVQSTLQQSRVSAAALFKTSKLPLLFMRSGLIMQGVCVQEGYENNLNSSGCFSECLIFINGPITQISLVPVCEPMCSTEPGSDLAELLYALSFGCKHMLTLHRLFLHLKKQHAVYGGI